MTTIITSFVCLVLMSPTLLLKKGLNKTSHLPVVDEGSQGNNSGPGIFEGYDETKSLQQRLERLDGFALYLKLNPSVQAYVISYGGRRSCRDEALRRAQFAKNYLSRVKSIDRKRITALDGGYLDEWGVQLWFGAQGESPPTLMPTVDRSKVQIIKNCKPKTSKRKKQGS
jgi:hypothetical protein